MFQTEESRPIIAQQRREDVERSNTRQLVAGVMFKHLAPDISETRILRLADDCCTAFSQLRRFTPEKFAGALERHIEENISSQALASRDKIVSGWVLRVQRFIDFIEKSVEDGDLSEVEAGEALNNIGVVDMGTMRSDLRRLIARRSPKQYGARVRGHYR